MKLYELNGVYQNIMALIDEGEATAEEMEAALADIQDGTEVKLDGYGKIIRTLESEAVMLKEEEARLAARRRHAEASAKYMKERVKDTLDLRGGDRKLKTKLFSYWVQKNPPKLEVDCPVELLPDAYQKHTIVADTAAIKDALSKGEVVLGCKLTQGESLRMK